MRLEQVVRIRAEESLAPATPATRSLVPPLRLRRVKTDSRHELHRLAVGRILRRREAELVGGGDQAEWRLWLHCVKEVGVCGGTQDAEIFAAPIEVSRATCAARLTLVAIPKGFAKATMRSEHAARLALRRREDKRVAAAKAAGGAGAA